MSDLSPSSSIDSDDELSHGDPGYEVDCVVDSRLEDGVRQYLVRWVQPTDSEEEWEDEWLPESNLQCEELVAEFHNRLRREVIERLSNGLSALTSAPPQTSAAPCDICGDTRTATANLILRCSSCRVSVHSACYGASDVSRSSDWRCDVCAVGLSAMMCAICPVKGAGAYKSTDDGRYAHIICALSCPSAICSAERVRFIDVDVSDNTAKRCAVCRGLGGALVECDTVDCAVRSHPQCIRSSGGRIAVHVESTRIRIGALCRAHSVQNPAATPNGATNSAGNHVGKSGEFRLDSSEFASSRKRLKPTVAPHSEKRRTQTATTSASRTRRRIPRKPIVNTGYEAVAHTSIQLGKRSRIGPPQFVADRFANIKRLDGHLIHVNMIWDRLRELNAQQSSAQAQTHTPIYSAASPSLTSPFPHLIGVDTLTEWCAAAFTGLKRVHGDITAAHQTAVPVLPILFCFIDNLDMIVSSLSLVHQYQQYSTDRRTSFDLRERPFKYAPFDQTLTEIRRTMDRLTINNEYLPNVQMPFVQTIIDERLSRSQIIATKIMEYKPQEKSQINKVKDAESERKRYENEQIKRNNGQQKPPPPPLNTATRKRTQLQLNGDNQTTANERANTYRIGNTKPHPSRPSPSPPPSSIAAASPPALVVRLVSGLRSILRSSKPSSVAPVKSVHWPADDVIAVAEESPLQWPDEETPVDVNESLNDEQILKLISNDNRSDDDRILLFLQPKCHT